MSTEEDSTAIILTESHSPQSLTASEIKAQVQLIQEVMSAVMQEGQHYGVIPGAQKPSLLKPGAEKLALTFRLAPSFHITRTDLGNGHREYEVRCTLTHIPSGQNFGEGVGCCSTLESKYRYRRGEPEDTGKSIPREYWDVRKVDEARAQEMIGGKGFLAKKTNEGTWHIMKRSEERGENLDLADAYNTVLKMAKKRAQVDATLTATAASDCFTQDLEDFQQEMGERDVDHKPLSEPIGKPQPKTVTGGPGQAAPFMPGQLYVGTLTALRPRMKQEGRQDSAGVISLETQQGVLTCYFFSRPDALKKEELDWATLIGQPAALSFVEKEDRTGATWRHVAKFQLASNAHGETQPEPAEEGV